MEDARITKVYVLNLNYSYEGDEIVSIHSTPEKAIIAANKYIDERDPGSPQRFKDINQDAIYVGTATMTIDERPLDP